MKSHTSYVRCYEKHPPLKIGDYVVYGGSCHHPVVKDADIYVGLDMTMEASEKSYPWVPGESFVFYIKDMHAPSDPIKFKELISWLAAQIISGKKVHIGCVGGHGRTGTVLAALVTTITGQSDSITYVRENYCKKAVESNAQVEFLHKYLGIVKVPATKSSFSEFGTSKNTPAKFPKYHQFDDPPKQLKLEKPKTVSHLRIKPATSPLLVWGGNVFLDKS